MAKDVITRFKLETTQYDSKLRDAAKGLANYGKTASAAGKEFDKFTKENVAAARSLGTIATSTTNAKDKVKELVGAFNEAAKAYNVLSKEQQQSDWGKAMSESLEQLQVRIREAKKEMQGLSGSGGGGGLFGGDGIKGMLQVFGGNLMTKAAGIASNLGAEMLDIANKSMELSVQVEGVRNAFERLNQPNLLANLRETTHNTVSDFELMKAAVKFNDFKLPLDELGTMLAFAQQKAKDTGQSVDYMVDSIVTGLGRKSLMILDNLGLSATEVKDKMAQTGDMTKAVGEIIREQMAKAGDYVETASDRAKQANVELENEMLKLGDAMRECFGFDGWDTMATSIKAKLVPVMTEILEITIQLKNSWVGDVGSTIFDTIRMGAVNALGPLGEAYNIIKAIRGMGGDNIAGEGAAVGGVIGHFKPRKSSGFIGDDDSGSHPGLIVKHTKTTPRGGRSSSKKTQLSYAEGSIAAQQKLVSDLTKQYNEAGAAVRNSLLPTLVEAEKKLQQMKDETEFLKKYAYGEGSGKTYGESTKDRVSAVSDKYNSKFEKENAKILQKMTERVIKKAGIGKNGDKSVVQSVDQMVGGISQMVGGLEKLGIELPEGLQNVLSGVSGIISILEGISIILIAIKALQEADTFLDFFHFAHGGVVPHAQSGLNVVGGTHYSGDVTPILANAGEVVLNNAQVQNLANNLQNGGGQQSIRVYGIMRGKDIVLTSDNYLKSVGKGQFVTTKNRKN